MFSKDQTRRSQKTPKAAILVLQSQQLSLRDKNLGTLQLAKIVWQIYVEYLLLKIYAMVRSNACITSAESDTPDRVDKGTKGTVVSRFYVVVFGGDTYDNNSLQVFYRMIN